MLAEQGNSVFPENASEDSASVSDVSEEEDTSMGIKVRSDKSFVFSQLRSIVHRLAPSRSGCAA